MSIEHYANKRVNKSSAFTIVELLIVVVVIAILAAITVVSYNGITRSAEDSALKSALRTAANKVSLEHAASGQYPSSLSSVGVDDETETYRLMYTGGNSYCMSVFLNKDSSRVFRLSSDNGAIEDGERCADHMPPGGLVATPASCFETYPTDGGVRIISYKGGVNTFGDFSSYLGEALDPACPPDVVIPAQINGEDVVALGHVSGTPQGTYGFKNAAFAFRGLTSVVMPDTVTSIDGYIQSGGVSLGVFAGNQLSSVTIPISVASIGAGAFRNNQLTQVTIPSSVTSIGTRAFQGNQLGPVSLPSHLSSYQDSDPIYLWAFGSNPNPTFTIRP